MTANEPESPNLAQRLGGRWLISWQAYAATFPFASVILVASAVPSGELWAWLAVGVVATLAAGLYQLLLHRGPLRNRASLPISRAWVVAAIGGVAGIYVITALLLSAYAGLLDSPDEAIVQFVVLFVVAASWNALFVLALDAEARGTAMRRALLDEAVQQELAALQDLDILSQVRKALHRDVSAQLHAASSGVMAKIDSLVMSEQASAQEVARSLRTTADSTVRGLSHDLEARAQRRYPGPSIAKALANIPRYQPFRPIAICVIFFAAVTMREIITIGAAPALGRFLFTAAIVVVVLGGFNWAMRRWPWRHVQLYVVGLIVIQALSVLLWPVAESIVGEQISGGDMAVSVVLGTVLILVTSAYGVWDRTRQESLRGFRIDVDNGTVVSLARNEMVARATREVATVLHGSVQSQLLACASLIEAASDKGDLLEMNRALVQARALLESPDLSVGQFLQGSLSESVHGSLQQWTALLDLAVQVDGDIDAPELRSHVCDVVGEGVANAAFHGGATSVRVQVSVIADCVEVVVSDDGGGPQGGESGMGSRLFRRLGGTWNLVQGETGAVLTVSIPGRSFRLEAPSA